MFIRSLSLYSIVRNSSKSNYYSKYLYSHFPLGSIFPVQQLRTSTTYASPPSSSLSLTLKYPWTMSASLPPPINHPLLTPLPNETFIFVYGSLLKGLSNHHRLIRNDNTVRYLGPAQTQEKYCMVGLGFPILSSKINNYHIYGELYAVQPSVLESLDQLEGHPDAYVRTPINVLVYPEYRHSTSEIFQTLLNKSDTIIDTNTGAQAVPTPILPTSSSPILIQASIYFGDIFWELEGQHNFHSLEINHGNFRIFWEESKQTGWKSIIDTNTKEMKRIEPPHPLPIDEPLVAFPLVSSSTNLSPDILSHFVDTYAKKIRYLGQGEIIENNIDKGNNNIAKLYFIPPRLLLELDKLYGYSPTNSLVSTTVKSSVIRRIPKQFRIIEGANAVDTNELGISTHTSRGSAPLDWIPGGNPVSGDILYTFVYQSSI